jgi:glucose-1-phosphate thymidylyltransferase
LYPLTISVSKQLMPIYDKPTIYYPIATLMHAGIREILIITSPGDRQGFVKLLGSGEAFGLDISYAVQEAPKGLAEAYIIAEEWLDNTPSVMILGDNFFHGDHYFINTLKEAAKIDSYNSIFAIKVRDPRAYGVVELDYINKWEIKSLEEKPLRPKSDLAVLGIYFLDERAPARAKELSPSKRGELEIMSLCREYMGYDNISPDRPYPKKGLYVSAVLDGVAWLDTGTPEGLLHAAQYVSIIEERHGYKIACLEEIALKNKWVSKSDMETHLATMGNSAYYQYIKKLL